MLTLRLKPALEQRLEALSLRTGRTKTFYATRAIEERLPEFEKAYAEVFPIPVKDTGKVGQAIATLKNLRKGVTKPDDMSVLDMKESGRS